MIDELDVVRLTHALPRFGLAKGDRGTVVHRYRDGEALEVEFLGRDGRTSAVLTLDPGDVKPTIADTREVSFVHARVVPARVVSARRAASRSRRIVVAFGRNGGWVVKRPALPALLSVHPTQKAAAEAARALLKQRGGGLVITKSRSGQTRRIERVAPERPARQD